MVYENSWAFFLLLALPVFWMRTYIAQRNTQAFEYTRVRLLESLPSWRRAVLKARFMFWASMVFNACIWVGLIVALSRPQTVIPIPPAQEEGLDIVVCIDTSESMKALDFQIDGKGVDRLAALKHVLKGFVDKRVTDRFGLVVFGQSAFTQSPLTHDRKLVKSFIDSLYISMVGSATALGDAMAIGVARLDSDKIKSKVLVLMTDGKQTAGRMDPMEVAQAAKTLGVKIYTIGIGKKGRVPYPVQSMFGGTTMSYQQSDLDETLLTEIATLTGGAYFRAYDTESFEKIYATIDSLEKEEIEKDVLERREEYFMYPLTLSVVGLFGIWILGWFGYSWKTKSLKTTRA